MSIPDFMAVILVSVGASFFVGAIFYLKLRNEFRELDTMMLHRITEQMKQDDRMLDRIRLSEKDIVDLQESVIKLECERDENYE